MRSLLLASTLLAGTAAASTVSPYDHVVVVMEENHEYSEIIGNKNAPNINAYATTYGLATDYDAVTHPSAPNYVALVGGSYFGIQDDDPWQTHKLNDPSLTSQLEQAGLSWRAYFQSMPKAGFTGNCYPTSTCLYASKHNGPIYFDSVNGSKAELKREVPITKLARDLKSNTIANYVQIIPDQCHDMHGGTGACANYSDAELVAAADTYLATLVGAITAAPFWKTGNNAIVVTWDEGSTNVGGGGQVVTIVITNNGPRAIRDNGHYTHYSLLGTIEAAFGLGCLQNTCTATLMTPLFQHP